MIFFGVVDVERGSEETAVRRRRSDGTRVHERDRRQLSARGFAALAALEIAGGMADRQTVVRGHVSRAETGTAERSFDHGAALHKPADIAVIHQTLEYGLAGRIHGQRKFARARGLAFEYFVRFCDIFVHTARAARDDALIDVNLAVDDLIGERKTLVALQFAPRPFDFGQDLVRVRQKFADRVRVAGVERQRDHRLYGRKIDRDAVIVIGGIFRLKFLVIFLAPVDFVVFARLFVRFPDGRETGGFGGHHVDAVAVIHG